MDSNQIENVFNFYGYGHFYDQIKGPIELSGILETEEEEQLEHFFDSFDFNDYDRLLFDEFRYFYAISQKVFSPQRYETPLE
ncbi:hypothetical protein [Heyndrickxia acidicola]|uniref:EF-hand domain-containing protein n=1 Tax=Heyndrickxia acidicola TaxID=209389 RepID=A0ABU6MGW8_9BACI|nr:hypothetical protein [Heyndrickxia acidicola]MED1202290.1 hypothetical protein [Heyndrickxia acidicola]